MSNTTVREAIDKLSGVFSAEPARARAKNASATARLVDGLKCDITGPKNEHATSDMPSPMGGQSSGPNPGWLMRAGMASCTATVIAMRAAKLGITLKDLEVTVESETDNRGMLGLDDNVSAGMDAMRMKVKIAGDADAQKLRELVAWAEAHSPVGCTIKNAPSCSLDIEIG